MFKFRISAFTRSFPGVCLVSGLVLTLISALADLGGGLIALGVLLIISGIGLQILYLYLRYSKRDR